MPIKSPCDLCDASYFTHKLMAYIHAYDKFPTNDLIDKMAQAVHAVDMLDEDVWQLINKCHHEALTHARKLIKNHGK